MSEIKYLKKIIVAQLMRLAKENAQWEYDETETTNTYEIQYYGYLVKLQCADIFVGAHEGGSYVRERNLIIDNKVVLSNDSLLNSVRLWRLERAISKNLARRKLANKGLSTREIRERELHDMLHELCHAWGIKK